MGLERAPLLSPGKHFSSRAVQRMAGGTDNLSESIVILLHHMPLVASHVPKGNVNFAFGGTGTEDENIICLVTFLTSLIKQILLSHHPSSQKALPLPSSPEVFTHHGFDSRK
jgi:hypothetical protein